MNYPDPHKGESLMLDLLILAIAVLWWAVAPTIVALAAFGCGK